MAAASSSQRCTGNCKCVNAAIKSKTAGRVLHLRLQQLIVLEAATQLHDRAQELQHARVLVDIVHFTGVQYHSARDAAASLNDFLADALECAKQGRVAGLAADGGGALAG